MPRPDLKPWFRSRIDWHTNGLMAGPAGELPRDVVKVDGDVTDALITATMRDGTVYRWSAGRSSRRKINLTYPPLMPQEIR